MGAALLLWTLTLLSVPASVAPESHYLVAFPAVIQHPSTEKFCVLLQSLSETIHLAVTLEMKTQNHTLVEKDVEKPHQFECISFQVPSFVQGEWRRDRLEEEVAHVRVLIRKGDSVSFEGRKKVLVRAAYIQHIIETDKPFYKPGETVRFRIVRLDDNFKALNENIPEVQLIDPNKNQIGQWLNVESQQGITDLSFPLASEAALGKYTIKVGQDVLFWRRGGFTVQEYVLPKFEVLIDVPEQITTSDEEIRIKVTGRYTYGKAVRGTVRLTLMRDVSYYFWEEAQNETLLEIKKEYTAKTDKSGCAFVTINATDINLSQKDYRNYVELSAELEEEGTGLINSGTAVTHIVTKVVDVSFQNLNEFYKHGFPYIGRVRCTMRDVPVKNGTIYIIVDVNDVETNFPYVTDENGEVQFSLDTTNWNNALVGLRGRYSVVNATAGDSRDLERMQHEDFRWLKPFYSESNSFLEIRNVKEQLPCGKDQEVLVDYIIDRKELGPEADHVDFYYLVVSKGKVVLSGQKPVPIGPDETLKGTFALTLSVGVDLAPTAWLLLYAVFADGEVAADLDVFSIERCLRHQVKLGFSAEEDIPGSEVQLQVEGAPRGLCSLRAVDKSVTLKEDGALTSKNLYFYGLYSDTGYLTGARGFDYHVEDFEPYPCLPFEGPPLVSHRRKRSLIGPWFESQADVYSLFKKLRMKLLTNTRVKKPVSCLPQPERRLLKMDEMMVEAAAPAEDRSANVPQVLDSQVKEEEKGKPRTHFPETWIWDLVLLNEEGKASHPVTAPDTITEWRADAFCVADAGFGLAQPAAFRVFQPFFVDLVLPYSVVRGETFELKATVFNYLKDCIQVNVWLAESQQVKVEPCLTCSFTVCLCSEEAETFAWNVTATQLGHVNLSVTTEAQETQELCGNKISVTPPRGRSDTVIKSLLVKPEGVLKEETHNAFLCSSGDAVVEEVSLKLPENVVEDSGRAVFSVIGDILGPSLQNLDQLLEMPYGCGEQNMAKFVPNIFVLRYLEATNQATPEIKAKAVEHMRSGYQRQLLYKHGDGSYSAFGKEDAKGNTWLTAFVARGFGQAKSYIYIDEKHVEDAIHWLKQHQRPSGCFESVGRLFNNALKGGVDNELSLTAYVAAALLELHLDQNGTMVEDALACLKGNLTSVHGAYARALSAYAFTLAGDTETRQQLLREEQVDGSAESRSSSEPEMVAYRILALLSKPEVSADDITEASQATRILVAQQNPYGGFSSTQDTVVALQALSRYAALTYHEIEGVQVLVKSTAGSQQEFHVDKGNRLVLQQAPLPEVPGQYKVEVSGSGCAYVQSTLRYNCPPEKTTVFALSVETSPSECSRAFRKSFGIHLQVSYTGPRESSNMALIEVNMVSGFIPLKSSVRRLEGKLEVKKVEFDPDKISLYLDHLNETVQHYHFSLEQEVEVTGLKPATVKVYDYYHPEDYAVAEYNAPCSTESTKEDSR